VTALVEGGSAMSTVRQMLAGKAAAQIQQLENYIRT
jgi:hypothetical protein